MKTIAATISTFGLILAVPALAAASTEYQIQPLSTRYAKTASKVTLDSTFRYFEDVRLQEMQHFDGFGFDLDLTVPFREIFQLRLIAPLYTEGKARVIGSNRRTDIKGYGGVFDFPSLVLEHQLVDESRRGYNAGWFIGFGEKLKVLETTHGDRLNHQGRIGHLGLKADRRFNNDQIRLLGNLGLRAYLESDDLNPTGRGDHFFLMDARMAAVGRLHEQVWPGLELKYRGEFDAYNSVSMAPQVIVAASSWLEMKFGVPFRLTNHGERIGARLQLTARF